MRRIAVLLLVTGLSACSSSSSTSVVVKVDTRPESEDPNLVVAFRSGDSPGAPQAASTPEPEIAFVRGAPERPHGIGLIGEDAGNRSVASHWETLEGPSWSPDGTRLALTAADGVYLLELGEERPLQIAELDRPLGPAWRPPAGDILLVATDDLFAVVLDVDGQVERVHNVTQTAAVLELEAAWSADGKRVAVVESPASSPGVQSIVVYEVQLESGPTLRRPGRVVWADRLADADHQIGAIAWGRTRDLLAVAASTRGSWDVHLLDLEGERRKLGREDLDERSPSWSPRDRALVVDQGTERTRVAVWELTSPGEAGTWPEVLDVRELADGFSPDWR